MHGGSQGFQLPNGGQLTGQVTSLFDRVPARAWRELWAPQKDQTPGPLLCHPAGDHESKVSQSSCYQVATIRPPAQRRPLHFRRAPAHQTAYVSPPLTECNLVLSIRAGDFLPQPMTIGVARRRSGFEIHQSAPERRMLLSNNATHSPKRRLSNIDG